MKKLFLLLLLLVLPLPSAITGTYIFYQQASLTSSAQKVTIQQVSSGTRDIHFDSVSMWCSEDATFTLSKAGTAATTTAGTIVKINTPNPASTVTAYTSSNVGSETTLNAYAFKKDSSPLVIDLKSMVIPRNSGTTGNLTLGTNSITATCRISFLWDEEL